MKANDWQAIIFDFDGVVAESGKIKTQAFAELYQSYGEAIVAAVVQHHNQNGGMSRYRKFRYYQQHFLDKPTLTADEEKELDKDDSRRHRRSHRCDSRSGHGTDRQEPGDEPQNRLPGRNPVPLPHALPPQAHPHRQPGVHGSV